MKWEVFNTHTAETVCHVPFRWLARLLCKADKTWDYDDKKTLSFYDKDALRREIATWRKDCD